MAQKRDIVQIFLYAVGHFARALTHHSREQERSHITPAITRREGPFNDAVDNVGAAHASLFCPSHVGRQFGLLCHIFLRLRYDFVRQLEHLRVSHLAVFKILKHGCHFSLLLQGAQLVGCNKPCAQCSRHLRVRLASLNLYLSEMP